MRHSQNYNYALKSLFIPRNADGSFAKCVQYDVDANSVMDRVLAKNEYLDASMISEFVTRERWPTVQCIDGWNYDEMVYSETLASKVEYTPFH